MRLALTLALLLAACPTKTGPTETGDTGSTSQDRDNDGWTAGEDCDDQDPAVHPEAEETCNGLDDDCDGQADEGTTTTWYTDNDGDGFGNPDLPVQACEKPADAVPVGTDCDDTRGDVYPSHPETCDGLDNNCDGSVDEGVEGLFWADADADGWGDPDTPLSGCTSPSGAVDNDQDCDDTTSAAHPGATEVCDERDNDCDDAIDEDVRATWWQDLDGDGWGTPAGSTLACSRPTGYAAASTDCDDGDEDVNPGETEMCNGRDDDCDGSTDEADAADAGTWYDDADGDGWGDPATAGPGCGGDTSVGGDCDDTLPSVHPMAPETCDGLDENCNGVADESPTGAPTWYLDFDGDGHGGSTFPFPACEAPTGYVSSSDDCDDTDGSVNPAMDEVCNGVDDDCDTWVDDLDPDLADARTWYLDFDGDGWGTDRFTASACAPPDGYTAALGDCDDGEAAASPEGEEVCDGIDNDCDGDVDEDALDAPTWYRDGDGDGVGGEESGVGCLAPLASVATPGDCDDGDPTSLPGATEVCDGRDNDCDGTADDGAPDALPWHRDEDGDGWGVTADLVLACDAPAGFTATPGDCDDGDMEVHPEADERCDGLDEDCDGAVDDDAVDLGTWYYDRDGDGYGDPYSSFSGCFQPSSTVEDSTDCDDRDATAYPGAMEVCDEVDNDCDGSIDEGDAAAPTWYADDDNDGYGDPAVSVRACTDPTGERLYVGNGEDCDDAWYHSHPGADEVCDERDNDCDGTVDEPDAVDAVSWYPDGDGDGHGDPSSPSAACDPGEGWSLEGDDCDDTDPLAWGDTDEVPSDGVDNDCDGFLDECELVVTSPSAGTSATCTVHAEEAGVLHMLALNPDSSLDGYFTVSSSTTGYAWLYTGTKSYAYTGSYTAGLAEYEILADLPAGDHTLTLTYGASWGTDWRGTDTLQVAFEPGASVLDGRGSRILTAAHCSTCGSSVAGTLTVASEGAGMLLDITSTGGGGGGHGIYVNGAAWVRLGAGEGNWEPFALVLPVGTWSITASHEDDYWWDNSGTRGIDLYGWTP